MNTKQRIQQRLRSARQARGLTQTEVAEFAGCSTSLVSFFESGAREPSWDMLDALADALDVHVSYLLGYECPRCGWRPNANND